MSCIRNAVFVLLAFNALTPLAASAHMTPPVTVANERDVVAAATRGAAKIMVREVRLTEAERAEVARRTGWRPNDSFYRFFVGRDSGGKLTSAVTFLSEFTIHGPVRVAVALGPDGKIKDAAVLEMTEETYAAFKPLLDHGFTEGFVGVSGRASLPQSAAGLDRQSLGRFYAEIVTDLVTRGAVLFDVAVRERGEK